MGEARAAAGDEIDVARHVHLADFHFFHPAVIDFPVNAHARHNGHAHAHLDETLDAFDSGHFDGHVEGGAVAREQLDNTAAEGRLYDMGDEILGAEFRDINFALFGERVFRRNNKSQLIFEDFRGLELGIAGNVGDGAQIEAVIEDFVGDIAGKHAVDADLDAGMQFAKLGQGGEKRVNGTFVDADGKFAALETFEFGKTFFDFVAEVDEAFGVFLEEQAGVGETDRAGASNEQGLAEGIFEFADGKTDSGLRAVQAFGGAGKAAFLRDHKENLQFAEVHRVDSRPSINQDYQMQNKDKLDCRARVMS